MFDRYFDSERESEPPADPDAEREGAVDEPRRTASGGAGGRRPGDVLTGAETTPPREVLFDLLKNPRRRRVLRYLLDEETPVELGPLAEHVAAVENGKDPTALTARERKRVYVVLYQMHLPRLADAGLVAFDDDRGRIDRGPHIDSAVQYVHGGDPGPPPESWVPLYLSVVLVGLSGYVTTQSGLYHPGEACPTVVGVATTAVAVTALLDLWRRHGPDWPGSLSALDPRG